MQSEPISRMDLASLYKTQISLTEWFENAKHSRTEELRKEDNDKRVRLGILHQHIQLPFDQPFSFPAEEIANPSPSFQDYFQKHGKDLCALRLMPLENNLPKLRMRGHTVTNAVQWFHEQKIDPRKYTADFVPHSENYQWSTIFVVNPKGIFGEIVEGGHHILTQGFHSEKKPIIFSYTFEELKTTPSSPEAMAAIRQIISFLHVPHPAMQETLRRELGADFSHDYLTGYFETVTTTDQGLWFIDYNRVLGKMLDNYSFAEPKMDAAEDSIHGVGAHPGVTSGKVRLVTSDQPSDVSFSPGEILVCRMTTPAHLPLMRQASAIVTDMGGILSHAAIIARELNKPCVIGTQHATRVLKDGDLVEVDANKGTVRKLK